MKTQIIKINLSLIERDKIDNIVDILREGGVVVYPTDTFYGLGANVYLTEAVKKIYTLKRRERLKPIPVIVSDLVMAEDISTDRPLIFQDITKRFWPGPLTIVLKASPKIPDVLQSPAGSIGVRWPDVPWLRELIRQGRFPLTATSANLSGHTEISDPDVIIESFSGTVDLIVDGGISPGELPSTVLDLTGERPRILREGALPSSEIRQYLEKPEEN